MTDCLSLCRNGYSNRTLHYISAAHGGWGIVRIATLVPGSRLLFVCPSACGRHNAIGGAIHRIKDRVSYLFLEEADIVAGDFERIICDGTDRMFEILGEKPDVLFIFTSCLDDLLGTDHEPILAELSRRHPQVKFRHCSMNPISLDTKLPPGITTYMNMFSLLERKAPDSKSINILGSHVSYDECCDLKRILAPKGYKVRSIGDCRTFDEFVSMGDSALDIVTAPIALKTAQELENRLGIPYIEAFVSYDPDEICGFYKKLSDILDTDLTADSEKQKAKAESAVSEALSVIGDHPIAVDHQAVLRPYSLALMLKRRGFNMSMIVSDSCSAFERRSLEALAKEYPDMKVEDPLHHDEVKFPHYGEKYLCIGYDCGYMTGSDKVADLTEDEGMFGYYGTVRLMRLMTEAYGRSADVRSIIEKAGLII